jgi:hypothetical protein
MGGARPMNRPLRLLFGLSLLLAAVASAQTPAGSRIVHQARATVAGVVVPSNQVVTVVAAVCRARISPESSLAAPVQAFLTKPLAETIVAFRVTNDGNDTFEFTLAQRNEGTWMPQAVRFHLDRDENGRLDPGDPRLERFELAPRDVQAFLMVVAAPEAGSGDLWITPDVACPPATPAPEGGTNDAFAKIGLRGPESPLVNTAISLGDAVAPADANGARRIEVRVEASNEGADADQEVVIEVPLDGDAATCFALRDASSDDGQVEVAIGAAGWWPTTSATRLLLAQGSDRARAVRLRLARLVGGEVAELLLQFDFLEDACDSGLPSIGTRAQVGDDVTTNVGFAEVRPRLIATLTPLARGDTAAGASARLLVGQPTCFPYELRNAGNAEDVYRFAFAASLPAADRERVALTLRNAAGLAAEPVLALGPGEAGRVSVCVVAAALLAPFDVAISVLSDRGGPSVAGRARIDSVAHPASLLLVLDATPRGAVPAGATLAYRLRVENGLAFTLSDLAPRVELAALQRDGSRIPGAFVVDPDSLTGALTLEPSGTALRWVGGELEPGFGRDAGFALTLAADLPDDVRIVASLAAAARELATLVAAPSLTHLVWSSSVLVDVRTVPALVRPGERFDVRIDVFNGSASPVRASALVAELPAALPLSEPDVAAASDDAPLIPPGGRATLLLPHRLLAQAVGAVDGVVAIDVRTEAGLEVIRDERPFTVRVDGGFRRDQGVLIGHVRDATAGTPVAGVRVVLADGRSVVSDERGRFAFPDVPAGWHRLLLDPATSGPLADAPERVSDHALRVWVHGLTRLDVVVARPAAADDPPAASPPSIEASDPFTEPFSADAAGGVRILAPEPDATFTADAAVVVIVEGPSGAPFEVSVAGVTLGADRRGAVLDDAASGLRREAYYAIDLRPGANEVIVRSGDREARRVLYRADRPVEIAFRPLSLVADGVTPIEIEVRLLDARGIVSGEGPLDAFGGAFLDSDAIPERAGYQALVRGGVARLRLPPRVGAGSLDLSVAFGDLQAAERFVLDAPTRTLVSGEGSLALSFPPGAGVAARADARLYLEHAGPAGGVVLAVDAAATLTDGAFAYLPPSAPDDALPLESGAVGAVTPPPRSEDGIGVRFVRSGLEVAYEAGTVAAPGVSASTFGSALRARLEVARDVHLEAFAGYLRRERVALRITPDGGRRYPLPSAVLADSERVIRLTWIDGEPFEEVRLQRGVDYLIEDGAAGGRSTLVLARATWPDDLRGGRVEFDVVYTPAAAQRDAFAHGVGVAWAAGGWTLAGGYATLPAEEGTATTWGATASYRGATTRLDAAVERRPDEDEARYRIEGRLDRTPLWGGVASGRAVAEFGVIDRFSVAARGSWPSGIEIDGEAVGGRELPISGRFTTRVRLDAFTLSLGHVQRPERRATEVALLRRWGGFSLGVATEVRWGDPLWTLIGRAGIEQGPLALTFEHRAPLAAGEAARSTLEGSTEVADTRLRWRLEQVWGADPATAALLAAERDVLGARVRGEWLLPLATESPSRLRLGVDAPVELAPGWTLDLQAGAERPLGEGASTLALGVGVRHGGPDLSVAANLDGVWGGPEPTLTLSARARSAALPADPRHSLSLDARVELLGAADGRFALGYAFHDAAWSLLSRQELRLSETSTWRGDVAASITSGVVRFRPGVAYRIQFDDPDAHAVQVGLGIAAMPAGGWLVGVAGYYVWQPGLDVAAAALGAEIGVPIAPGTYLVFGYTVGEGPGLIAGGAPGWNVRLDVFGGTP